MTASFGFDVAAVCNAMQELPRLVILNSPSNPVGTALTGQEIAKSAEAPPPLAILVMEEVIIVSTNLTFSEWPPVFDDTKMTTAVFVRLTHHCDIAETGKESWRFMNRA